MGSTKADPDLFDRAADMIAEADALLIAAGAGMGVDSGLPDFRGTHGFWRAYPAYAALGLDFPSLANPRWFKTDPALAWGFYGHRMNLYRAAEPHRGFDILRSWATRKPHGAFVFTSNIDGQFQRAGFGAESIVEIHGAIAWMQCTGNCGREIFRADSRCVDVDGQSFRAVLPLPACPRCGALARPNVLMFDDFEWDGTRTDAQLKRFTTWCDSVSGSRIVVVECGAGDAVPTVRHLSERAVRSLGATLIRINPRETAVPRGQLAVPTGALVALAEIDQRISRHDAS
jgi:NAD-dependent SIR2 family protein deacetylase